MFKKNDTIFIKRSTKTSALDGIIMDYAYDKYIGNNIKNIRESKGLTQDELAAKLQTNGCDITRSALAKIEVGQRHIYSNEIRAIKEALRTSYEELIE